MIDGRVSTYTLNRVADWYEGARVEDRRTSVRCAYQALVDESMELAAAVRKLFIVLPTADDPYPTSQAMMQDAVDNGILRVFKGGMPHPQMVMNSTIAFRIVHDYTHILHRLSFSTQDEVRAGLRQAMMYSTLARPALMTETVAHTAYYWRHREYAPQKAVLMPQDLIDAVVQEVCA